MKYIILLVAIIIIGCSSLDRNKHLYYEVDCKKGTTKVLLNADSDEIHINPNKIINNVNMEKYK
jgi:hypothetical protein